MNGTLAQQRLHRLWSQGEAYLAQRNLVAARVAFESLLRADPSHVPARLRLSTLATHQGRYRESVAHLLAIVASGPDDPYLLSMLAGMLHRLGESQAALACASHPALRSCGDRALLEETASLASQLPDYPLALRLLDAADRIGTASEGSLYLRATIDLFEGRLAAAEAGAEACLARAPSHPQAHWLLSRIRRQEPQRNHVARLQDAIARERDPGRRAPLEFALFKELDDLGRHDEAWLALTAGCAGKRRTLDYRSADEQSAFDALQAWRPPASTDAPVPPGPTPIFIVGLPRTGTTLLERILGGLPEVENAGELDDLPLQLRWCCDRFSKQLVDASMYRAAAGIDFRQLGQRYLEHAQWRARGKPYFTDKLPLNYLHVGFIAAALPQARILHMVRNPMDSCLSNLKELFAEAYPYSYRLDELADHYGRYRRLMAHWHGQWPGRIHDVVYEDLVADPERVARQLLAFCGLPWRAECLGIEANTRPVSTASSVQVRQPIHGQGVESWRKYATQLEPLRQRLAADGWLPA